MSGAPQCIVDSLECYMDEMIDSFESFVKKSLLLISIALGSVIIMAIYMLKVLSDRTIYNTQSIEDNTLNTADNKLKRVQTDGSFAIPYNNNSIGSTSRKKPDRSGSRSSTEEKVIREIGFSTSSKPCNTSKQSLITNLTRTVIPSQSLPNCASKQHECRHRTCTKYVKPSASCCSACCVDSDRTY